MHDLDIVRLRETHIRKRSEFWGQIILHIVNNEIREENDDLLDIGILEALGSQEVENNVGFLGGFDSG